MLINDSEIGNNDISIFINDDILNIDGDIKYSEDLSNYKISRKNPFIYFSDGTVVKCSYNESDDIWDIDIKALSECTVYNFKNIDEKRRMLLIRSESPTWLLVSEKSPIYKISK